MFGDVGFFFFNFYVFFKWGQKHFTAGCGEWGKETLNYYLIKARRGEGGESPPQPLFPLSIRPSAVLSGSSYTGTSISWYSPTPSRSSDTCSASSATRHLPLSEHHNAERHCEDEDEGESQGGSCGADSPQQGQAEQLQGHGRAHTEGLQLVQLS